MKYRLFINSAIAALAVSCATATTPKYTVNVTFTPDEDGMQLYMLDYDSGNKLDSAIVENGVAVFKGIIEKPVMTQLVLDGSRAGQFILEAGNTDITPAERKVVSTGTLNNVLSDLSKQQSALAQEFRSLPKDSTSQARRDEILAAYNALNDSVFQANVDNAVGLNLFLQKAYEFDRPGLDEQLAKYPQFANSVRVQKLRKALVNKEETSVGHKFKDFAITNDGKTQKLSDYVGKGKYTLVDFWASWCGPCIRETKVIKELYNKYADKGLEVLGVAVWDEPANTLKAIEQHQLPWKQIINAQTIPTDIYGISGIPCIILFDPEGNIISRDKQDQELINDVDAAMAKALDAQN